MPQEAWSAKRERQYKHIKQGLKKSGRSEDTAEEIAARTVNKERARAGESKTASRTSTKDISSGRRGGLRVAFGLEGAHEGAAVPGGQAQGCRGPFEDDEGSAPARRRSRLAPREFTPTRPRRSTLARMNYPSCGRRRSPERSTWPLL